MPARAAEVLAARLRGLANAGGGGGGGSFVGGSNPPSLASDEEHFPSLGGSSLNTAGPSQPNVQRFGAPPGFNADGEATARSVARDVSIGGGGFERVVSKRGKGRWSAADGGLATSAFNPPPSRQVSKKAQAKTEEDASVAKEAADAEVAARSDALVARVRRTLDAKGGSFNSFASLSSQFKSGQCSGASYVAKLCLLYTSDAADE